MPEDAVEGGFEVNVYYKLKTDANIWKNEDDIENREAGEAPILKEEVEKAIHMPKNGKSPGVDNISAEILRRCHQGLSRHVRKSGPMDNGPKTGHSCCSSLTHPTRIQ